MTYQEYIHQKLKKMSLLERVNAQSKQVQLVQNINYEQEKSRMERDVRIHMGADAGIQYVEEKLFKKEMTEEPILFDYDSWAKTRKENIENNFSCQMEDRKQRNKKAFKAIQARTFEKAAMSALYGEDSLETYEESSGL